jgi:adenylate cyclase, class 1
VQPDNGASQPVLKRAWTLVELIAWAHFNGLYAQHTHPVLFSSDESVELRDLEAIRGHLHAHVPARLAHVSEMDDYASQPYMLAASAFINVGVDPMADYTRLGKRLTTDRVDALDYSGAHRNLVCVVDYLVVSSWREILTYRFHDMDGLMSALCEHLRWVANSVAVGHEPAGCRCLTPGFGGTVASRMERLFGDVAGWWIRLASNEPSRYVVKASERYYVLLGEAETAHHEFTGSYDELVRHLGRPDTVFSSVHFDRHALENSPLPLMYGLNKPDTIQFFFETVGRTAQLFVLDEQGALFEHEIPYFSQEALLRQYAKFFESVTCRLKPVSENGPTRPATPIEYRRLVRDLAAGYRAVDIDASRIDLDSRIISIQVIGRSIGARTEFTLYCDDVEFSALEYGDGLFAAVAEHVRQKRLGGETYPIYITDIDLSQLAPREGVQNAYQTINFLNYKKAVELRLKQALQGLAG